jgi:hypothetical protein
MLDRGADARLSVRTALRLPAYLVSVVVKLLA